MKTETLRNLAAHFESDQAYLEIAAEFEENPARQAVVAQRAGVLGMIAAQIRGELTSRDSRRPRPAADARRFEAYLERVLQDYLGAA